MNGQGDVSNNIHQQAGECPLEGAITTYMTVFGGAYVKFKATVDF